MPNRTPLTKELGAIVRLVTTGAALAPDAAADVLETNRKAIAAELRAFGEDAIASQIESATLEKIAEITKRGSAISLAGERIDRACCLAAVELVEGKPRPLARKRRKNAT